jgi:hypothetical protein
MGGVWAHPVLIPKTEGPDAKSGNWDDVATG